jgi:hypothetical protein
VELVMANYAEGFAYWDQVELVMAIEKMLGGSSKCDIIIDYGGAGIAVEEIFIQNKKRYPICILFS